MSDLSSSFNKRNLRLGLASVLLSVGMAAPLHAQEAPSESAPATPTAADTTPVAATTAAKTPDSAPAAATATTLDTTTCMETTTTNNRRNFLVFGNSRSKSTTTYNEQCGENQKLMARSNSIAVLMSASNADGTPDITMRAMGLQLYRQSDEQARQHVDAMLLAHGMNVKDIILSLTPEGAAAVCVRQSAAPIAAATAGTPVRASISFRCTAPGATTPVQASATPPAGTVTAAAPAPAGLK